MVMMTIKHAVLKDLQEEANQHEVEEWSENEGGACRCQCT